MPRRKTIKKKYYSFSNRKRWITLGDYKLLAYTLSDAFEIQDKLLAGKKVSKKLWKKRT